MRSDNVQLQPGYTRVCVWPGRTVYTGEEALFIQHMQEKHDIRVQFLEQLCFPDQRGDYYDHAFFAVHDDDLPLFDKGTEVRWVEDAMAKNLTGYPERIRGYCKEV